MTTTPGPTGPTADALCQLVLELDRDRRSGWARVAELEKIILEYREMSIQEARRVAWRDPTDHNALALATATIEYIEHIDPDDRDIWPPDVTAHRTRLLDEVKDPNFWPAPADPLVDGYREPYGNDMTPTSTALPEDDDPTPGVLDGEFCRVDDLAELGFGERKALYAAVKRGDIPSVRLGRKVLIPTAWVRQACRRA